MLARRRLDQVREDLDLNFHRQRQERQTPTTRRVDGRHHRRLVILGNLGLVVEKALGKDEVRSQVPVLQLEKIEPFGQAATVVHGHASFVLGAKCDVDELELVLERVHEREKLCLPIKDVLHDKLVGRHRGQAEGVFGSHTGSCRRQSQSKVVMGCTVEEKKSAGRREIRCQKGDKKMTKERTLREGQNTHHAKAHRWTMGDLWRSREGTTQPQSNERSMMIALQKKRLKQKK